MHKFFLDVKKPADIAGFFMPVMWMFQAVYKNESRVKQVGKNQKIAAFGSSYRDINFCL
ncbi:hypothetical protein D3C71_1898880 [compost metagenome]